MKCFCYIVLIFVFHFSLLAQSITIIPEEPAFAQYISVSGTTISKRLWYNSDNATTNQFNWQVPSNVNVIDVFVFGGGGGGGGGTLSNRGGGGGSGGEVRRIDGLVVSPFQVYELQIGRGGARGTGNVDGQNGDPSYLRFNSNTIIQSNAGLGGLRGGAGGTGGPSPTSGSGGNLLNVGQAGVTGSTTTTKPSDVATLNNTFSSNPNYTFHGLLLAVGSGGGGGKSCVSGSANTSSQGGRWTTSAIGFTNGVRAGGNGEGGNNAYPNFSNGSIHATTNSGSGGGGGGFVNSNSGQGGGNGSSGGILIYYEFADITTSTMNPSKKVIVKGGGIDGQTTITLQLKDANGLNASVSAGSVSFSLIEGTGTLSNITDNLDGSYTVTLTSGNILGKIKVGATIQSSNFTQTATVWVANEGLTISSVGESGSNIEGANWSVLNGIFEYTGNAIIQASVVTDLLAQGDLTIKAAATASGKILIDQEITTISTNELILGAQNNLSDITVATIVNTAGPITIYGGTIALNNMLSTTNTTTGDVSLNGSTLSGSSTLNVANGRTLTFNLSANTTYAGVITGDNLNVVKEGTGLLALTGSNTPNFATLTISAGTYRLNSNQQLTLSGALTNNGTFTMRDGATFVQATSGTSVSGSGTYNVQKLLSGNSSTWNTTNSGRFWYMGVPMNSTPRSGFGAYNAASNRVWTYSEQTKQYTQVTNDATALVAGTGYVHRRMTDDTLSFSATGANGLFASDLTLNGLTRTSGSSVGFNLIANPYMAYLDWHAVTKTNVESTYYIRSNNAGSDISALITYNGSNQQLTHNTSLTLTAAQMQYIAPMQAIWVRVGPNTGTGSLAMTRSMLSHQSGNPGLKSSTIFPTLARVNLVDGARFDQMLVFMNQDMTNGVDQYDSEKMFVSGAPQLYTMAAGKKLVMNGLKNNKKKISVPLYLELPQSKVYQLQLADYNLEDGLILLEDKQEGTIQDFTIHDTYAFYANSGVLQNRFVLHFYAPDANITAQGPSNTWVEGEAPSYTEGGNIVISSDAKGKVQISLDQPETDRVEGTVQVTDANGRLVHTGALAGLTTEFQLEVPAGIYYLMVQSGNLIENKKVFIQE